MRPHPCTRTDTYTPTPKQVTKTVLRFINLSGRSVPWGNRERAGEMTLQMAMHRYAGPASVFHSCAPDDVHNPDIVRWAHAFGGYGDFPAHLTAEFEQVPAPTAASTHPRTASTHPRTVSAHAPPAPLAPHLHSAGAAVHTATATQHRRCRGRRPTRAPLVSMT